MEMESGYAELNGTRLYYEVAGSGQPLVLIHGMSLVIPDAGHMSNMEAPDAFNEAVLSFLTGLDG